MTLVRPTRQTRANQFSTPAHEIPNVHSATRLNAEAGSKSTRTCAGAWNIDFPGVLEKAPAGDFSRCLVTSTPTTTISTPAGRAFPLASRSLQIIVVENVVDIADIKPSCERRHGSIQPRTSAGSRGRGAQFHRSPHWTQLPRSESSWRTTTQVASRSITERFGSCPR
jgi:hypothetical protein